MKWVAASVIFLAIVIGAGGLFWYNEIYLPEKERQEELAQRQEERAQRREAEAEQRRAAERRCSHVWAGRKFKAKGGIFGITQYYDVESVDPMNNRVVITTSDGYRQTVSCYDIPK